MEYPDHMFLVDRMLGRLVAWLRIFGYDTKSALDLKLSSNEDTLLIEMAKSEGRILLSRDKENRWLVKKLSLKLNMSRFPSQMKRR